MTSWCCECRARAGTDAEDKCYVASYLRIGSLDGEIRARVRSSLVSEGKARSLDGVRGAEGEQEVHDWIVERIEARDGA
ncbi:hypothetical protein [Paraburkholderia saeva]